MQEDEKFLSEVFAQLTDEATDDDKRCELVSRWSRSFFECFKLRRLGRNGQTFLLVLQSLGGFCNPRIISSVAQILLMYSLEKYFLLGKL